MNALPKTNLIDRAAAALEPLGLTLRMMKQPRGVQPLPAAAWVRVGKGREHIDYLAEPRRTVTPATLGALVMQLRHMAGTAGRPALLVTDYLTPQVAEALHNALQITRRALLQAALYVGSQAFAEHFGAPFQIATERLLLKAYRVIGRQQRHQGDSDNQRDYETQTQKSHAISPRRR